MGIERRFGLEVVLVGCGGDWNGVKDVMGRRGCVGDGGCDGRRGGVVEALVHFGTVEIKNTKCHEKKMTWKMSEK